MAGYLKDVFGLKVAPLMGITAEELYTAKTPWSQEEMTAFFLPKIKPLSMSVDSFVRQLDKMGVEKTTTFNLDEETPSGLRGQPNDYYAEIVQQYPDRLIGIVGIDPLKGIDAVREVRRCCDLGLRGVTIRPFIFGIPPHHRKIYPVYIACTELSMPIWFHLSINYSTNNMEVERTIYPDIVSPDFHELKMIGVAWWNKKVYFDFTSYMPKHLAKPGSGWESLFHYGMSVLQDRVILGPTWMFKGHSIRQLADQVPELLLKEETKR